VWISTRCSKRNTVLVLLLASYIKTLSQLLVSRFDFVVRERENRCLINTCQAEHQTFAAATEYTGAFGLSRNLDGLLGLAYPSLSSIEATPVLQTLIEGKQIANAVFGVSLSPSCSELHLGGINSKYSDQDFTHVDVVGEVRIR
jgi:hypothetical protein